MWCISASNNIYADKPMYSSLLSIALCLLFLYLILFLIDNIRLAQMDQNMLLLKMWSGPKSKGSYGMINTTFLWIQ